MKKQQSDQIAFDVWREVFVAQCANIPRVQINRTFEQEMQQAKKIADLAESFVRQKLNPSANQ